MIPLAEVSDLTQASIELIRSTREPDEDDLVTLAMYAAGIAVAAIRHAEMMGISRQSLLAAIDAKDAIDRACSH
jgi:hypothetical protein